MSPFGTIPRGDMQLFEIRRWNGPDPSLFYILHYFFLEVRSDFHASISNSLIEYEILALCNILVTENSVKTLTIIFFAVWIFEELDNYFIISDAKKLIGALLKPHILWVCNLKRGCWLSEKCDCCVFGIRGQENYTLDLFLQECSFTWHVSHCKRKQLRV